MTRDSLGYEKVRKGQLFAWRRGDWLSPAFPYLEDRPWTPILVADTPCFVACDTGELDDLGAFSAARWCVVWGDQADPWFQDVANLQEHEQRPLYLARRDGPDGPTYHAVWGGQISQGIDRQVTLRPIPRNVTAIPLGQPAVQGEAIALVWHPLDTLGS